MNQSRFSHERLQTSITKTIFTAISLLFLSQITLIGTSGVSAREISNPHARSVPILSSANDAVSESITQKQMYQTRFNFGVNFGGCFLRETWIFPSLMPAGANTELEAITQSVQYGRDSARIALENHWNNYASDEDWDWLQSNKINSIRVPIGYWNVNGCSFVQGTLFEPFQDIYQNSWQIFKSKFIEPAAKRGISVIVDLHGVPGGANPDAHNGEHIGKAEFWTNPQYQDIAIRALEFIAQDLQNYDNIAGIQVINEAQFSDDATSQKAFYKAALQAIRKQDKNVPVIISDGWWPNQWVDWIQAGQENVFAGLVVDHHVYRCFSEADKAKSALQITNDLDNDLMPQLSNNGNGVDFMVGEWSVVLSSETWDRSPANQEQLTAQFGNKQEKLIEEKASGGSFFWTFKFESGNGGGWDIHQQLGRSFNPPCVSLPAGSNLATVSKSVLTQGKSDVYNTAFTTAWNDVMFYAKQGSLIGRKQAVKFARRSQYLNSKGNLGSITEWDSGFDDGLREAEGLVTVE